MPDIGPDGHPIPEQQGVVAAVIAPMHAKDMRLGNIGQAIAGAKGSALYLPNFTHPPAKNADGSVVLSDIECVPLTLEQAGNAARRVLAMLADLPLNESAVDVMNMAFAIVHYENKGVK